MLYYEKSKQAIEEGLFLLDNFDTLTIKEEVNFSTTPHFALKPTKMKCFLGTMSVGNEDIEVVGSSQKYIIRKEEKFDTILDLHHNPCQKNDKNGFDFIPLYQDSGNDFETYNVKINPFYSPLKIPKFIKKYVAKKHPLSALITVSLPLNKPLNSHKQNDKLDAKYYCYSFLNVKVGPSFFGFGPGKFDHAIKHYALETLNDTEQLLTLTALISPRSKKVLNILGIDPVYGMLKIIHLLTFSQFNIYEKYKAKIELNMMTHHVNVHEEMLKHLF